MALDLKAIRNGLKTRLATVDDIRCYPVIPEKPELPAAIVAPAPGDDLVDYGQAFQNGLAEAKFEIVLLVSRANGAERAQDTIDGYLSAGTGMTTSLIDAIEGDRTLGGACSTLYVSSAAQYGTVQPEGQPVYQSARLIVSVRAPRS